MSSWHELGAYWYSIQEGATIPSTGSGQAYDPLYRLTTANYDSGEFFHYTLRQAQGKPTTPSGID